MLLFSSQLLSISSSSFFFSLYGDHRDLHSFPTRRSSDLAAGRRRGGLRGVGDWLIHCELSPGDGRPHGEDRKSTRLNSSHRCISYAVFCLKKKKKMMHAEMEKR